MYCPLFTLNFWLFSLPAVAAPSSTCLPDCSLNTENDCGPHNLKSTLRRLAATLVLLLSATCLSCSSSYSALHIAITSVALQHSIGLVCVCVCDVCERGIFSPHTYLISCCCYSYWFAFAALFFSTRERSIYICMCEWEKSPQISAASFLPEKKLLFIRYKICPFSK